MKIRKILKKVIYGHKANSVSYVSWLKSKSIRIGENVTIYTHTKCSIDETRPFMIEIGDNVEITEGVTILMHSYDWSVFKHYSGDCMGSCSAAQLCEAKELYKNYKKSYDSEPP